MNMDGIRKLKHKIISIMTVSFIIVMVITGLCVNLVMQNANSSRMDQILEFIVEHGGELSDEDMQEAADDRSLPGNLYLTRYFTVYLDADGNVEDVYLGAIQGITYSEASGYAERVLNPDLITRVISDQIDNYYYKIAAQDDGTTMIVFADGSTQSSLRSEVFMYTIIICLFGALVTFVIISMLSNRIIRPEVENARRQKEFITNASHELKTPLAVIRANTEILEMMNGENDWTQSTMRQVEHLNSLIQNLVMITKSSEQSERGIFSDIDLSKAVRETAEPFKALAIQDKKQYEIKIEDGLKIRADDSQMRQLASLLTDNAFKYCDENGRIEVGLTQWRKGKMVRLWVSNSYAEGKNVDYNRFFERFYREDKSHTNQKGFGIGLSLAESICQSYGGTISASWKDGIITFQCLLPVTPADRIMTISDRIEALAKELEKAGPKEVAKHLKRKQKKKKDGRGGKGTKEEKENGVSGADGSASSGAG